MNTFLDCIPCFFTQALRAAESTGLDEAATRRLINEIGAGLSTVDLDLPPPANAHLVYAKLAELSGCADPYAGAKAEHTAFALSLLPRFRELVRDSDDPLDTALRIAAAGNIIDLGAFAAITDIEGTVQRAVETNHECWDIEDLRDRLEQARRVLVVGDNAGETVFDRVLLETFATLHDGLELFFSVRGAPVINDATEDDARAAGLHEVATLVSTGSAVPGVMLDGVSAPFRRAFDTADLVVAKGQGNLETLLPPPREVFFVLTVKCRVVADLMRLGAGSSVLWRHGGVEAD